MEYFNSENVIVTDSHLSISGTNYTIKDMKSAYVAENSSHKTNWNKFFKIWIGLVIFSIIGLAALVFLIKNDPATTATLGELIKTAAGLAVIFAIAALIPILFYRPKTYTNKGEYILFLSMEKEQVEALSSKDHSWLSQIQEALSTAITKSRI